MITDTNEERNKWAEIIKWIDKYGTLEQVVIMTKNAAKLFKGP